MAGRPEGLPLHADVGADLQVRPSGGYCEQSPPSARTDVTWIRCVLETLAVPVVPVALGVLDAADALLAGAEERGEAAADAPLGELAADALPVGAAALLEGDELELALELTVLDATVPVISTRFPASAASSAPPSTE